MKRVAEEKGALFILGDLFDFWFEYKTVIPKTAFGFLASLDATAAEGTPVYYIGGNHDFWLCDFLDKETHIQVLADGTELNAQGKKTYLAHGDGLGPGDTGYKILKKVFRNPLAIWLFRWVHPDLGIKIALSTSHVSREHTSDHVVDVERLFRDVAKPELLKGRDAMIVGHHHVRHHAKNAEGEFLILGDWFRQFTYARLQGGSYESLAWTDD